MKQKTVKSCLAAVIALAAALVSTVASAWPTAKLGLPAGYTRLESIRSTGTQWITTDVIGGKTIGVDFKFRRGYNLGGIRFYLGVEWANYRYTLTQNGGTMYFQGRGENLGGLPDESYAELVIDPYATPNLTLFSDGAVYKEYNVDLGAGTKPLVIFAGTDGASPTACTVYGLTVKKEGEPYRDYIPAREDSTGALGLYETATDTFCPNEGTGEFVAGPVVPLRDFAVADLSDVSFDGTSIPEPSPAVTDAKSGTVLTAGVDYDVTYSNNHGAGIASAYVIGKNAYAGTVVRADFAITCSSFDDGWLTTEDASVQKYVVGDRNVYVFTNVAAAVQATLLADCMLEEALLVGGGGGGASGKGGGGGAGGVLSLAEINRPLAEGAILDIGVGAGGAAPTANNGCGGNGANSTLAAGGLSWTAFGGGRGGNWWTAWGDEGGCGGGGSQATVPGMGVKGQGFGGGLGTSAKSSGGGGGAGGEGGGAEDTDVIAAGAGGPGVWNAITGIAFCYGGGGGAGGSLQNSNGPVLPGVGGIGGGGNGGQFGTSQPGVDGLGGGGGGGGFESNTGKFGNRGGNGTVIIRLASKGLVIAPIPEQAGGVGGFVCPKPEVTALGTGWPLNETEHYDLSYRNNDSVGTATVIVTGKGEYAGCKASATFVIAAHSFADDTIASTDPTVRRLTNGDTTVYVFTNAAATKVTMARGVILDAALLVGGGGAGSSQYTGGGGAGGGVTRLSDLGIYLTPGTEVGVTVGAGGIQTKDKLNGNASRLTFGTSDYSADGGASGSGYVGGACPTGGSGGGSVKVGSFYASGGGGGAGTNGGTYVAPWSGAGGDGIADDITGVETYYGGGGGGGGALQKNYVYTWYGLGGLGGGADGGRISNGEPGVDGLGGGGRDSRVTDKQYKGGRGGSGTIILAFREIPFTIADIPDQPLAEGNVRPKPVLTNKATGLPLVENEDYTLAYANNNAPGTAVITITGLGVYTGIAIDKTFEIVAARLVTPTAAGGGDGRTWDTAMTFAEAVASVQAAGGEIWLKQGTYAYSEAINPSADVVIRGGYAGLSGASTERPAGAKSTLSGEDAHDALTLANAAPVTLERIVITRGLAHGLTKSAGAGSVTLVECEVRSNGAMLQNYNGSNSGRGLYFNTAGITPKPTLTVTRCVFAGNVAGESDFDSATAAKSESGTALYARQCTLIMSDTAFVTNGIPFDKSAGTKFGQYRGTYTGAAIYLDSSDVSLTGCRFVANRAPCVNDVGSSEGCIVCFNQCATVALRNCLFAGNSVIGPSVDSGAGALVSVWGGNTQNVTIDRCTFAYNLLRASASAVSPAEGKVKVRNSVFYGNVGASDSTAPLDLVNSSKGVTVDYSVFAGTGVDYIHANVTQEGGLVAADPQFVTTADDFLSLIENEEPSLFRMAWPYRFKPEKIDELVNIDCHLLSAQGYVDNAGVRHTAPGAKSPAIDAGDPTNEAWHDEPGENGGRLNAGAYAGTAEASETPEEGEPEIDPEGVAVTFPNEWTQPQIAFTMSGDGVYLATVRIFCGTGELAQAGTDYAWTTEIPNVGNGQPVTWKLPGYVGENEEIYYAIVAVTDAGATEPVRKQATAQGKCPPWAGKGGGANVMHVRSGADGSGDGSDWSNAYPDLGAALGHMTSEKTEVWVAGETPISATALSQVHTLSRAVKVRGGFLGVESAASERPAKALTTIDLGGDLPGLKLKLASGAAVEVERFRFVNASARALTVTHNGASLAFSACEIENNVMGFSVEGSGTGPVSFTNCLFAGNLANGAHTAAVSGRALYVNNCVRLTLDDCLFVTNGITAAYADAHASQSVDSGAAFYLVDTKVTARNVRFAGNCVRRRYNGSGGGICRSEYTNGNSPAKIADSAFTNCLWVGNEERYTGNRSTVGGGVVWLPANGYKSSGGGDFTFANCTFAFNLSVSGGGDYDGHSTAAGINVSTNRVLIRNSVFYGNMIRTTTRCGSDITAGAMAPVDIDYTLFAGEGTNWVKGAAVTMGEHNVYGSPQFVTTDDEFLATIIKSGEGTVSRWGGPKFDAGKIEQICAFNVHLRGRLGYVDETTGETVTSYRRPKSPAVDAGDPASDYRREPSPNGKCVNLGFYGNTPWATMSKGGTMILVK